MTTCNPVLLPSMSDRDLLLIILQILIRINKSKSNYCFSDILLQDLIMTLCWQHLLIMGADYDDITHKHTVQTRTLTWKTERWPTVFIPHQGRRSLAAACITTSSIDLSTGQYQQSFITGFCAELQAILLPAIFTLFFVLFKYFRESMLSPMQISNPPADSQRFSGSYVCTLCVRKNLISTYFSISNKVCCGSKWLERVCKCSTLIYNQ